MFDAAIRVLSKHKDWVEFHKGCSPPCEAPDFIDDIPSCEAAIRVLEAAGKVDKDLCLFVFDRAYPVELETFPMIRNLLSAIPDKIAGTK